MSVFPSKIRLCPQIDPICVLSTTQISEGLVDVIAGEVMAVAKLNLWARRGLAGRNKINLLTSETAVLRMDAVAARHARRLVDLVKQVARGCEPEHVLCECNRRALRQGDARLEVRIDQVLPGEEVHRAVELVVRWMEVHERVVILVAGIAVAGGVVKAERQTRLEVLDGDGVPALNGGCMGEMV